MGKLILPDIYLSVKQNLNCAWILGPHALGKLILYDIFLSIKQKLGHAWILGPHTLYKLIPLNHFSNSSEVGPFLVKTEPKWHLIEISLGLSSIT